MTTDYAMFPNHGLVSKRGSRFHGLIDNHRKRSCFAAPPLIEIEALAGGVVSVGAVTVSGRHAVDDGPNPCPPSPAKLARYQRAVADDGVNAME